jgi:hypothetical protein
MVGSRIIKTYVDEKADRQACTLTACQRIPRNPRRKGKQ